MKHLHTTLIALLISSTIYAQVPSYVPTDGLVGWWPFNGNAQDESGNGNNGNVVGATPINDRFGTSTSAYGFNGSSNFVDIGNNTSLKRYETNYTVSAWVNPYGFSNLFTQSILSNRNVAGGGSKFGIAGSNAGLPGHLLFAGADDYVASPDPMNLNEWAHVCVVFEYVGNNNNIVKLFINGLQQNTDTIIDDYPDPGTQNSYIGFESFSGASSSYYFNGGIDDVGMWNRTLNADEIQSLYNAQPSLCVSIVPVSFSGLDSDYLTSDGLVTLSGSPTGGIFVGPGINQNTFDPASAGEGIHGITYMYADAQGCLNASSQCTSVSIGMGVEPDDKRLSHIRVFPNPNRGQFTVEFELTGLVSMQLFDTRGALAHTEVLHASGAKTIRHIDLSRLAPGIYTLHIQDANGSMQLQVVIH